MGSLTRYFPGGAETLVNGGRTPLPAITPGQVNAPSIGGLPDLSAIFAQRQAVEAERERRAARLQALQMRALSQGLAQSARQDRMGRADQLQAAALRDQDAQARSSVQDLQLRAMQSEQQLQDSGPPLRMVTGFNITPGYMPDVIAMTARQRQAFLPGHSVNKPSEDAYAQTQRTAEEDVAFDPYRTQRKSLDNARANTGGVEKRGQVGYGRRR